MKHIFISLFCVLQEIAPTKCPLNCGLECKNPTSLDNHLKTIHSVTKGQIKSAQRIPMNGQDFLLVLAPDNVMCFTSKGCDSAGCHTFWLISPSRDLTQAAVFI